MFVQGVHGVCRVLCRVFPSCAGCAGSIHVGGRVRARNQTQQHTGLFTRNPPCTPCTYCTHLLKQQLMKNSPCTNECTPCTDGVRVIRCSAENAKEVQQLVKNDQELLALVQSLQEQGMFPGLRALSFTFTGDANSLAKGLGAWPVKNATQGE